MCEWGRKCGVPTPINDRIVEIVKKEQAGELPLEEKNIRFFDYLAVNRISTCPLSLPPRGICILFIYAASSFFGKKLFAKAIPFCFILCMGHERHIFRSEDPAPVGFLCERIDIVT